ncbi:MAG: hypothetical protein ABI402_08965 [Ferruginibacter sp.]
MLKKTLLAFTFFISSHSFEQVPIKSFAKEAMTDATYASLRNSFSQHKIIPVAYEKPILLALCYFPELIDVDIEFRIKHVITPLASRPAWTSILKGKTGRKYVITISDTSNKQLSPILFKELDFDAQVGVIGHEISHVVDFNRKNTLGVLRVGIGNLSSKFLDKFEYGTDSICIAHGLGYQLLAWSIFVRKALMHENWDGADNINSAMTRERYMNPGTIRRRIGAISMYHEPLIKN